MENTSIKPTGTAFRMTVLVMLALVVLGRYVSYFNTVAATDIAYAAWVSSALSYLAEILVCARTAAAVAGITFGTYRRQGGRFLAAASAAAFLDYAARFTIDFVTGAIAEAEILALSWLLMQFLFEMLFLLAACAVAGSMRGKLAAADSRRQAEKYTDSRACAGSLLLVLLARLALEVWYLIDFLNAYTDITAGETASIVGAFLKVIVIYGGAALLCGEGFTGLLNKTENVKRD